MPFNSANFSLRSSKLTTFNFGHTPESTPPRIRHNTISWSHIHTSESLRHGSAKLVNTLSPNIFEPLIPTTSTTSVTDVVSPQPGITYSPQDRESVTIQRTLQCSLEEIKMTESQYLSALKTLNRDYFQKLIEDIKIEVPVPITNVCNILTHLIEYHGKMNRAFAEITDLDIHKRCSNYCRIIAENGINVHLYKWYCSQHKIIQDIFHSFQSTQLTSNKKCWQMMILTFDSWFKGWQNFNECQQSPRNKKDFSLMSLLQRPIDRITKYRLFMESILKNYIRLGYDTTEIQQSVDIVRLQLSKINCNLEEGYIPDNLSSLVNFQELKFQNYQLDSQFFGIPYLIGTCWVIYVENKTPKCQNVPIVLFKSHILLLEYHYSQLLKFNIKFVIPVTKCYLDLEAQTSSHGLHTMYPYCVKLQFQIGYRKFEALLCWVVKSDYDIWIAELSVIIQFVNQCEAPLSTSLDMIEYLYRIPPDMSPCDVQTSSPNFSREKENSYFNGCYLIEVQMDSAVANIRFVQ
ncbi:hypothetical protein Cantr_04292 [Candida viswanathii]|uniref:DH domain-containing protein n=1 Tax=Candida viswanathii TaxID=5486 RepID=A0A367XQ93_9ASCO|nr:hypothetical protein Cantr_04292 [Candida viswanathii]